MKTLRQNKKALASWVAACLVVTLSWAVLGAIIVGTPGADLLIGTAANDTINGRGGSDLIIDLGGNDLINTHSTLVAGEAPGVVDIVIDVAGNDRIFGGPELLDILIDLAGNNKINTGGGLADLVVTGPGNDDVAGASAAGVASVIDLFLDLGGSNVLNGNGGLVNLLFGGPGNDTLTGNASLFNVLLADFTFTGVDRNILKAQAGAAFGIPGISVLIDSFGPDTMTGGNNTFDFLIGIFGAPITSQNVMNGGDENFATLPFPGDILVGGIGKDVYTGGKGFDFNIDPLGGNDTFVVRPGDTIAGTFELEFCGGPPGTDRDVVQLKGFNVRTTVITPILSSGLPGTIPGDILALVSDPNSGAFSGYALVFCEVRTFTR